MARRAVEAEDIIRRVEEVHHLVIVSRDGGYDPFSHSRYTVEQRLCSECNVSYPCTTIRTMNE